MFQCWILFKPVLVGVDGSLHLTEPSMNSLSKTESVKFLILPFWGFNSFGIFVFSILMIWCSFFQSKIIEIISLKQHSIISPTKY
jgi:hypothetical protein